MTDSLRARLQASLGSAYAIDRELGGGGMSRVFVARDQGLGREVVIKVLSPELAATLSTERFTREIRLAAALQEPHIVPVLAAGQTADGLPWYTMPFVRGDSLRARLAAGRVPAAECVDILRDVARALAYAHERGIVHRDIKPENVLLSSGTAVVTDFGIAKALSASATGVGGSTLTSAGSSIGTPAYMAPEQAVGDAQTDHRADVYAWGVMAWELLAGAHPFAGSKTASELVRAHISQPAPPLAARAPELPAPVAALVMRCLEKSPGARPPSMSAVLAELAGAAGFAVTPPGRMPARRRPWSRRTIAAAAGTVAVLALLATWVVPRGRPGAGTAPSSIETIAVLPFVNVGGDARDEYFSDGITDELAHALSKLPGLRLAGRSSSFAFKGRNLGAREIGRQLEVAALVEGTVRRAGERLRITVQLTSSADGKTLWQDSYENDKGDVFQVQDAVTKAIVGALAPRLRGARAEGAVPAVGARGTSDTAAYDLYMQGRYFWARRGVANLHHAVRLFQQAIAKDPSFARAYAGLGLAYAVLPSWSDAASNDSTLGRAEAAARRALAIDSTLADAWLVRSSVSRTHYQLPESMAFAEAAIRLEPSNATAHQWYGIALGARGLVESALAELRRAQALDPLSNTIANNVLQLLLVTGDFAGVRPGALRIFERDSLHYFSHVSLSTAEAFGGRPDSALRVIRAAQRMPHAVSGSRGREVFALAAAGRWAEADALRAHLATGGDTLVSQLDSLLVAIAYGEYQPAVGLLARGIRAQGHNTSWFLSVGCDPLLAPLRQDPGYVALMRQYGVSICSTRVTWPITSRPAAAR